MTSDQELNLIEKVKSILEKETANIVKTTQDKFLEESMKMKSNF